MLFGARYRKLPRLLDPVDCAIDAIIVFDLDITVGIDAERGGDVEPSLTAAEAVDLELGDPEWVIQRFLTEHLFIGSTHDFILLFTNCGQVHWLKVYDVPQLGRAAKGRSLVYPSI